MVTSSAADVRSEPPGTCWALPRCACDGVSLSVSSLPASDRRLHQTSVASSSWLESETTLSTLGAGGSDFTAYFGGSAV